MRGEALGFDSVWLGEHHLCDYILSSPPVVLAAIAERTTRLRLGTAVTLLGSLDPVRAAEDYATLDVLSNGRAEVVAGRGVLRRTYSDFGLDPGLSRELFEENVACLLAAWSGEPAHFEAKHRPSLRGVSVHHTPSSARTHRCGSTPPAAPAPAALDPRPSSARSHPVDPRASSARSHPVDRRRQQLRIRRSRGAPRPALDAAERARRAARVRAVRRALPRALRRERPRPRAGETQAPAAPPPQSPDFDALCRGPSICGSPGEVADRIASMRELLGLELHLAMFDPGGIPDDALAGTLELFAAKVIPQVTAG